MTSWGCGLNSDERRAEEHARTLLGDYDVVGLRLEFSPNSEVRRIERRLVALGRGDQGGAALRAHVAG